MKIFEELARDNIVNIVNYGVFHGGLNLRCRLINLMIWDRDWRNKSAKKRCFIMYSFEFVKAFFFFFILFTVFHTIRIIN